MTRKSHIAIFIQDLRFDKNLKTRHATINFVLENSVLIILIVAMNIIKEIDRLRNFHIKLVINYLERTLNSCKDKKLNMPVKYLRNFLYCQNASC